MTATTPPIGSSPSDLATILCDMGNEWVGVCDSFVNWTFSDHEGQTLIYSPVNWNELTQMGALLRALERAHPALPKLCEVEVVRKDRTNKHDGNPRVDLWFSYNNTHSRSIEVYLEAKVANATWTGARFAWVRAKAKKGSDTPGALLTPEQLVGYAEDQVNSIDFSRNAIALDHKGVVALFVVFRIPASTTESRNTWTGRIDGCLQETEAAWIRGKQLVQWDFDAGHRWDRLKECSLIWEKGTKGPISFCPRARLYLFEVPDRAAARADAR